MIRRTRRANPEEGLQRTVAEYLDLVLPPNAFWFHVPSGGKRTKAEAGILKAMGAKAGILDICIIYRKDVHFIELKAKGEYFSASQKATMPMLERAGAYVWPHEVRSIEDMRTALGMWGLLDAQRVRVRA